MLHPRDIIILILTFGFAIAAGCLFSIQLPQAAFFMFGLSLGVGIAMIVVSWGESFDKNLDKFKDK